MVSMVCFLCSQVIPTTIPSTAPLDNKEIRKIVPISLLLELLSSSSPCSPTCRSRKKIAPQFAENFESCEFCPACAPMISEMEEIRSQISILEGQMGQKVSIIQDMLVNSLSVEGQSDDKITQLRTSVLKTMRGDKTEQDGNVVLENVAVKVEADEGNLFLDENYETFDYPNSFSGMELNSEETDPLKLEGEDNDDYDESSFCIHPQPRKRRGRGRPVKPKTRRGRPPKSQSVGKEKVSPSPRGDKAAKSEENSKPPPDRKRCSNRPKKKVVLQKVAVKTTSKNVKKIKNRKILICPSPYCEKSFVAEYTLNYHIARHHHIPCPESGCSAKFGSEKEKRAHIKDAHGTKVAPKTSSHPDHDHVCHICRKKFISNDSLRSHVRRRHDESKRPQCETCGEKFLHESTLQSHRVREHGADHLVCEECGAIFSSQLGLRQHKWRHSGIKPHKCEQCGASFSIKRDLDLHLSSHSSQRQDPCLHCDLVFKNKEQVRAHVKRIHTVGYVTPTPHKCAQCGKSFQYPVHLRAHVLQVHTGERPFICAQCGKGFASKSLLSVHLKRKCGGDVVPVKKDRLPRSKRDSFQEEEVDC